jgi:cyclopropane fatty-acyl-phospholipid synthase-like methyltransferase
MIRNGDLPGARSVLEMGCGTGRLARRLLRDHLPPDATYTGIDLSPVMVRIARTRLKAFAPRATIVLSDGSMRLPDHPGGFDRVVSSYVMDLLSPEDIGDFIHEARAVLAPEGRICLVSLTCGEGRLSRSLGWIWNRIHRLEPRLLGGCRPVRLTEFLDPSAWSILHHATITTWGVASEILIARPGEPDRQSSDVH